MSQEKVRVAVTVSGGVCEAHTCPAFVDLFIIDYDNLKETALADIDPSTAEWLRENDKEFWDRRVKEDTSMKEVFLMGDQPTTCAKCGCHTNFTDNFDGTQDHVCLGCGFKFVVEVDTPECQQVSPLIPYDCLFDPPANFRNYYRCSHVGSLRADAPPVEWDDDWECACNDRCPVCNHEIEPYESEEI